MERLTIRHIQAKVDYLKKLGVEVCIDHHQPGDAKYTYAVESPDGSRRRLGWSGRMNTREVLIHLAGMIYVLETQRK